MNSDGTNCCCCPLIISSSLSPQPHLTLPLPSNSGTIESCGLVWFGLWIFDTFLSYAVAVRVAAVPVRVQYGNHLCITGNDRFIIIIIIIIAVERTRSYNIISDFFIIVERRDRYGSHSVLYCWFIYNSIIL